MPRATAGALMAADVMPPETPSEPAAATSRKRVVTVPPAALPEAPERRPRWYLQLALAGAFYYVYAEIRDLHGRVTTAHDTSLAQRHALDILRIERFLHIDIERGLQHQLLHLRPLIVAMDVFYGTFHFIATVTLFVCLLLFAPPAVFRRARNLLATVTALALVGFALLPTMPPRLLPQSYHYVDTMATIGGLWSYNNGVIEHISDPFAAFPSLHIAWATWCSISLGMVFRRRWQRILLACYPVLTATTVLTTGTHWVLDLVAGEAMLTVAWFLVTRGERLVNRLRGGSDEAGAHEADGDAELASIGDAAATPLA